VNVEAGIQHDTRTPPLPGLAQHLRKISASFSSTICGRQVPSTLVTPAI
jgi:hypothetical protein